MKGAGRTGQGAHRRVTRILLLACLAWSVLAGWAFAAGAAPASFRDCPDCPSMITLPAGQFLMGQSAAEEEREQVRPTLRGWASPQHTAVVDQAFAIGLYPVTRAEYQRFFEATQRADPDGCLGLTGRDEDIIPSGSWKQTAGRSWRDPGYLQTPDDPVVCVSYDDAVAYTQWLARRTGKPYRLVSETEWEYAARAGSNTARFWGDQQAGCQFANLSDLSLKRKYPATQQYVRCDDGYVYTSPVGSFRPNPFGLFDMLGNVWEWTADCWRPGYGAPTPDTPADCNKHVLRGSGWEDVPWSARSAVRFGDIHDRRSGALGFRVARTAP